LVVIVDVIDTDSTVYSAEKEMPVHITSFHHTDDHTESYEELISRAQNSEDIERDKAFNALISQFSLAAHVWAFQILQDTHAAQDVVQEAFITAYERLDDLREPAAFPRWLRRIVWTHCNRNLRQSYDVVPLEDVTPATDDPASVAEQHIRDDRIRTAVQDLPEHERVVTELFYLNGYSQQEIAEYLQLPLTTIKKRLQYAREHLRETIPPHAMMRLQMGLLPFTPTNPGKFIIGVSTIRMID
jgi:RNA polymerase sigma factor (sigma-70 family)